jgi:hypothetical protein
METRLRGAARFPSGGGQPGSTDVENDVMRSQRLDSRVGGDGRRAEPLGR